MCVYTCVYIYIYIHIYVYMYLCMYMLYWSLRVRGHGGGHVGLSSGGRASLQIYYMLLHYIIHTYTLLLLIIIITIIIIILLTIVVILRIAYPNVGLFHDKSNQNNEYIASSHCLLQRWNAANKRNSLQALSSCIPTLIQQT